MALASSTTSSPAKLPTTPEKNTMINTKNGNTLDTPSTMTSQRNVSSTPTSQKDVTTTSKSTTGAATSTASRAILNATTKTLSSSGVTNNMKSKSESSSKPNQPPIPTEEQVMKLQKLMSNHYQILLQQAVLAVRAAHGNKFQDGHGHSHGSDTTIQATYPMPHPVYSGATGNHAYHHQQQLQQAQHYTGKRKRHNDFFFGGETADELGMILDGAVTMLQDLDENRKDAIRYSIQMSRAKTKRRKLENHNHQNGLYPPSTPVGFTTDMSVQRVNDTGNSSSSTSTNNNLSVVDDDGEEEEEDFQQERGILTRSAFIRTLQESKWGGEGGLPEFEETNPKSNLSAGNSNSVLGLNVNTLFGVKGLASLDQTFAAIDNSLNAVVGLGGIDVFDEADHGQACEILLQHARADYDKNIIPGYRDLSELLTYPGEIMGSPVEAIKRKREGIILNTEEQLSLRKNRVQFTASEDNLLLRGVNLYGEKEWTLISDRYLPDRSISSISQRYWRLCLLIYKGQGIKIDDNGELFPPPKHPRGVEDFDEEAIAKELKLVAKPIEYGLYRWSMEEDIMLLKSVPLMGRMFAEVSKRVMPHRDRGALRKRYQVLERRVKGALKRDKKSSSDIVRKKVAPLIDAIARKKPLPVNVSVNQQKHTPTHQIRSIAPIAPATSFNTTTNRYNAGQTAFAPVSASSRSQFLPPPSGLPQARKNFNQLTTRFSSKGPQSNQMLMQYSGQVMHGNVTSGPTPKNVPSAGRGQVMKGNVKSGPVPSNNIQPVTNGQTVHGNGPVPNSNAPPAGNGQSDSMLLCSEYLESPRNNASRIGFERIINGEYSQMSAMKNLFDGNDTQTKSAFQTKSKGSNSYRPHPYVDLPNFFNDTSYSGLSMLSNSADFKTSYMDKKTENGLENRKESIISKVLRSAKEEVIQRKSKDTITSSPTERTPSNSAHASPGGTSGRLHNQSMDDLKSFSMLRSIPAIEELHYEKDSSQKPYPPMLSNVYSGLNSGAFSQYQNVQSSNWYNPANNSLMVPGEYDAATTLSQMSNSSANFPSDLLSSPKSPYQQRNNADISKTKSKTAKPSLFQKVKDRTKK